MDKPTLSLKPKQPQSAKTPEPPAKQKLPEPAETMMLAVMREKRALRFTSREVLEAIPRSFGIYSIEVLQPATSPSGWWSTSTR